MAIQATHVNIINLDSSKVCEQLVGFYFLKCRNAFPIPQMRENVKLTLYEQDINLLYLYLIY